MSLAHVIAIFIISKIDVNKARFIITYCCVSDDNVRLTGVDFITTTIACTPSGHQYAAYQFAYERGTRERPSIHGMSSVARQHFLGTLLDTEYRYNVSTMLYKSKCSKDERSG
ncbi:uncharacterized protein LOC111254820 [Varroa destructor]|uniref:Uncharacterized protein n=1 Tax=Varroa destructor TaxID=109461 RepID=A0A7M7L0D2_VARDE|nr:uncharacterized protein LOC111254820 [Varroa destructor]